MYIDDGLPNGDSCNRENQRKRAVDDLLLDDSKEKDGRGGSSRTLDVLHGESTSALDAVLGESTSGLGG